VSATDGSGVIPPAPVPVLDSVRSDDVSLPAVEEDIPVTRGRRNAVAARVPEVELNGSIYRIEPVARPGEEEESSVSALLVDVTFQEAQEFCDLFALTGMESGVMTIMDSKCDEDLSTLYTEGILCLFPVIVKIPSISVLHLLTPMIL
jgi:hypothetical protein